MPDADRDPSILRDWAKAQGGIATALLEDRDRLAAELAELREACRPIAVHVCALDDSADDFSPVGSAGLAKGGSRDQLASPLPSIGDLRRLAALLPAEPEAPAVAPAGEATEGKGGYMTPEELAKDILRVYEPHESGWFRALEGAIADALRATQADAFEEAARLCDRIYQGHGEKVRECDSHVHHEALKNRAGGAGECAAALRKRAAELRAGGTGAADDGREKRG